MIPTSFTGQKLLMERFTKLRSSAALSLFLLALVHDDDFLQDRALQLTVFVPPRILYCNDISVLIPGFVDSGAAPDNCICTIHSKRTRCGKTLVANLELVLDLPSNEDALDSGIPSEPIFVRTPDRVKERYDVADALDNHNRDGKRKRSEVGCHAVVKSIGTDAARNARLLYQSLMSVSSIVIRKAKRRVQAPYHLLFVLMPVQMPNG